MKYQKSLEVYINEAGFEKFLLLNWIPNGLQTWYRYQANYAKLGLAFMLTIHEDTTLNSCHLGSMEGKILGIQKFWDCNENFIKLLGYQECFRTQIKASIDEAKSKYGECMSPWAMNFTNPGMKSSKLCNASQMDAEENAVSRGFQKSEREAICRGISSH